MPDRDTHPDADGERDVPDDADWSGTVPKLSVTHRVLAALPQLRRPSSDQPSTTDGGNGNGAETPTRPGRPAKNGSGTEPGGASGSGPGSGAEDSLATDVDTVDDEGVEDEGVDAEVVQGELVDDETGTGPAPAGAGRRRDSFLRPRAQDAKHDPDADKTPAELVHMIKTIDDRERLYALFSAPLGAALGVAYTAEAIRTHPHALSGTILFQGLAPILFALILLVAVRTRKRSFVAFMLIFMGLPILPVGLLFSGLGLWMVLRSYRWQRLLNSKGGDPDRARSASGRVGTARSGATARSGGRSSAGVRDASARGSAAARRRRKRQPETKGPAPNKRYTPPKPPRPRPPKPEE